MDVEKQYRAELISGLGAAFTCFEEVSLRHAVFTKRTVRADVVAIPEDGRLAGYALAFEVKRPDRTWDYSAWSNAIRQATDYVYAKIEPAPTTMPYAGRRIVGVFMYPSPGVDPEGRLANKGPFVRPDCSVTVTGVFHMALHLRVGRAFWETTRHGPTFCLAFGPNPVWESRKGFRDQGINLIAGKRTLGSQRIDVRQELDGWVDTSLDVL